MKFLSLIDCPKRRFRMKRSKNPAVVQYSGCLMPLMIAILAFLLFVSSLYLFPQWKASLGLGDLPTSFDDMRADQVMGYKTVEIQEVVLLEAKDKAQFIVLEQEVEVEIEISQMLWNIPLFEKTKKVHAYGKGAFGVDLSRITKDSIVVDHNNREIYIKLEPASLMYVEPDYTKTTYEDTKTALLAFGEIKMTQEQQTVVNQDIKLAMTEKLTGKDILDSANAKAIERVQELLQPFVIAIVPGYKLTIKQEKNAAI
ncbi:MAG: DUF4230 domain-containing protein [Clostridia bacterium]|nr:DUF4230 domain-containing protein [Clostridia bacterium]